MCRLNTTDEKRALAKNKKIKHKATTSTEGSTIRNGSRDTVWKTGNCTAHHLLPMMMIMKTIPWRKVFEKLIVPQLLTKDPAFYAACRVHKRPSLDRIPSQMNPLHTITLCFSKEVGFNSQQRQWWDFFSRGRILTGSGVPRALSSG